MTIHLAQVCDQVLEACTLSVVQLSELVVSQYDQPHKRRHHVSVAQSEGDLTAVDHLEEGTSLINVFVGGSCLLIIHNSMNLALLLGELGQ